jgi:hypothetical protein
MRGNVLVVLATIALFLAGLFVGVWTQRSKPVVPPPPLGPMGEFDPAHHPGFAPAPATRGSPWFVGGPGSGSHQPVSPQELRERISTIMPQIADFQQKVEAIEQRFRTAFDAILTPDQKQKLDAITKRLASFPNPLPGCAPGMGPIFVSMVIYRPTFEHLSGDLTLDDRQQHQLMDLLTARRNSLLALVDATPPPSFKFPDLVNPDPAAEARP